jgi:diguanylate cyclase (GGDEF)-like protein/PAS domain S-box-containing protein
MIYRMKPDSTGPFQFDRSPAADDAHRIATLLRLVPRSMAITAATAILVAVILSGDLPAAVLGMWLGIALLICVMRFGIYAAHAKDPSLFAPRQWENVIACGAFAMGATWAALTLLGSLPAPKTLFVGLVLAVAVQSSSGILSVSARSFAAFATPVAIALAALLFRESGGVTVAGAIIVVLFVFALATAFLEMRRAQLNFLREARLHEESFRQQRLIFEAVQSGIAVTRNRVISDFNARATRMLGYTHEDLIGKSSRELFFDDETWKSEGAKAFQAMADGQMYHAELTLKAKNGAPVACEMSMGALTPRNTNAGVVIMFNDITERKRLEASLKEALTQQQAVFDNAPVGIVFTRDRKVVTCNERMLAMFGYQLADVVGRDGRGLYPQEDTWRQRNEDIARAFARGEQAAFQEAFVTRTGETLWCQVRAAQVEASDGAWGTAVFTFADINDRKRMEETLRESREQLDLVVRASRAGMWDWNLASGETSLSPRFAEILGFRPDTPVSAIIPLAERVHPEDRDAALKQFVRHLKSRDPVRCELRLRAQDGSYRWINADGITEQGPDGKAVRSIGAISDITELKEREAEIERLALHDPLTGLPNRRLFEDRLEFALTGARRVHARVAIMLIDLDGFKSINDQFGHDAGDAVLRGVSERLTTTIRASDTVARTGGDEFVVIAEGVESRETTAQLAAKILHAIRTPVAWQGQDLSVGGSIGISLYPDDADHPAQLVRMADEAMYRVKDLGRNGIRFHSDASH